MRGLLSMLAACSSDSAPPAPSEPSAGFGITTATVPAGHPCAPYSIDMNARGGTSPYTWALADGSDPLPEGLTLTSEGKISGVLHSAGDFSFTIRVTDSSPTPKSANRTYDLSVDMQSNPSLAIYFDPGANICSSGTAALMPLDCYVFIMLDGSGTNCAQGCEFKIRLTDEDDTDLAAGSQYAITSMTVPDYVGAYLGDPSSGIALSFTRPMSGPAPIMVASFDLLLMEDLQNLSFKFEANPNGSLGMVTCDAGFPIVDVAGREAAVNCGDMPSAPIEITTAAVPGGYTCAPYNTQIAVEGGTAPYTWTLAAGSDPLPEGIVLTADGTISGVVTTAGDFNFTVRVTDSSPAPLSIEKAFTMSVDVPSDPSMAVFFDGSATVCTSATTAWTPVNCYIFIMLDEQNVNCAQACEFKLRITDVANADLDPGSQYAITSVTIPEHVAVTLGDLFAGMALAFNRPMYGPEPILVASFDLLLLEDLQDLSFKFEANPNSSLGIASCDVGNPIVPVTGRESAINY
jgi:hypothetical protein